MLEQGTMPYVALPTKKTGTYNAEQVEGQLKGIKC